MRRTTGVRAAAAGLVILGLAAATAAGTYAARSSDGNSKGKHRSIAMRDDCDPTDPGWAEAPGGCLREKGNVTRAEFMAAASSSLSTAVVGHQSWRNTPSYAVVEEGTTLRIKNTGGRGHSFTKVAEFGGGVGPPFVNKGLTPASECLAAFLLVEPGQATSISGLAVGDHLFQCCIHPWMRAQVTVKPKRGGGGDDDDDDGGGHHHH